MARPATRTVTGVGNSLPFIVDTNCPEFALGFGCIATGTVNYTVQHCYDDSKVIQAGTATWFDHATAATKTANADGNYNGTQGPVSGVRVKINSGTGSVIINIVQTGPGG